MASFRKEILGQNERIDTGIYRLKRKRPPMLRCCSPNRAAKGYWYGLKRGRTTVPRNQCWDWESCLSIRMNSSAT